MVRGLPLSQFSIPQPISKGATMATQNLDPLQPVHNLTPYKHVQGTHQVERFFRVAAELDVDKEDIKRYYEFVDRKIADLLLMAQHTAKSNDRITVEPRDLPITKGLQENIHAFEKLDLDIGLERILDNEVPEPQIDLPYSDETESRLPAIAGGMSLALAHTFKIIDPQVKHPATEMWERAFQIFNQLL
jgi:histone H3/H4